MSLQPCLPCDCAFPIAPIGEQGPPGNPGPTGPRGPSGGSIGTIGVLNIEELRAFDTTQISNYGFLATTGYYESGDGGEGLYYYLEAATDTDDGGSVIEPDSGVGRFFLHHNGSVSLKQFGAKIDGTYDWFRALGDTATDDYAAVQAAIDYASASGAEIFQPPGYCRIGSPLTISKGWGITWRGKPFTYVTLGVWNPPTIATADLFLNSVLVRDFDGVLFTMRGALSIGPSVGFPLRAPDADIQDYDLSSGYRHTGSLIENIVLSSVASQTTSQPCMVVKRIGRCTFRNMAIYRNSARAIEILSADDSSFERVFFYVNGNTSAEKAVRLRRTVAETATESTYTTTNTLHFQTCDWEGNNYGNFDTSPSGTDTGTPQGLYFDGSGLMKTVHAAANGVNCVSIFSVTGIQLDLAAVNMTADSSISCTEILKLDSCSDVRGKFFMQQTGTSPNLTLTRYVTLINVDGCSLDISMFSSLLATDVYMVNADSACSQINVTGTLRFPSDSFTKKLCNASPNQVNTASNVQIGEILDADMSITTDQLLNIRPIRYKIEKILADKASVDLTTAAGGVYTNTGKPAAPAILVPAAQVYSSMTLPTKNLALTLTADAADSSTDQSLYLSLTTGQPLPAAKLINNAAGNGLVGSGTNVIAVTTLVHVFTTGNVVEIAGATGPSAVMNGRFKITVINPLSFSYTIAAGIAGTPPALHATPNDSTTITATLVPTCDIRVYGDILQ